MSKKSRLAWDMGTMGSHIPWIRHTGDCTLGIYPSPVTDERTMSITLYISRFDVLLQSNTTR